MKTILIPAIAAAGLALTMSSAFALSNSPQGRVVNGFDDPYNYIIAGFNDSFGIFGGRDFYEVRTTAFGKVPCYVEEPKEERMEPGFKPEGVKSASPLILVHCKADPGVARNEEGKIVCSTCFDGLQQPHDGEQLSLGNADAQVRATKVVSAK